MLNYIDSNKCVFLEKEIEDRTRCLLYCSNVRPVVCMVYGVEGFDCSRNGIVSLEYSYEQAEDMMEENVDLEDTSLYSLNEAVINYVYKKTFFKL